MWWIVSIVLFLYAFLIFSYSVFWYKNKRTFRLPFTEQDPFVSIIVAVRNEEDNLPSLLKQLLAQDYFNFELIIVDDHSTDQTLRILSTVLDSRLKVLSAEGQGKKMAIQQAVLSSSAKYICCFDADCTLGKSCVSSLIPYFVLQEADLLIGPVCMASSHPFQALEFLSLSGSAGGSAYLGNPVLCNGANLAFTRKSYLRSVRELHKEEASGDDMFLLSSIKKRKGKIVYVKDRAAIVTVAAQDSLRDFLQQRARWVSKSKSYTDYQVMGVGFLVVLVQVLLLFTYFSIPFDASWVIFIVFKFLIDIFLLVPVAVFFKQKKLLLLLPVLSIIYPIYVLISVFFSFGKIQWKGRRI